MMCVVAIEVGEENIRVKHTHARACVVGGGRVPSMASQLLSIPTRMTTFPFLSSGIRRRQVLGVGTKIDTVASEYLLACLKRHDVLANGFHRAGKLATQDRFLRLGEAAEECSAQSFDKMERLPLNT